MINQQLLSLSSFMSVFTYTHTNGRHSSLKAVRMIWACPLFTTTRSSWKHIWLNCFCVNSHVVECIQTAAEDHLLHYKVFLLCCSVSRHTDFYLNHNCHPHPFYCFALQWSKAKGSFIQFPQLEDNLVISWIFISY